MPFSLKTTLFISLFWHALCFIVFEPTFGNSLNKFCFTEISFLGYILNSNDFIIDREGKNVFKPQDNLKHRFNQVNFKPHYPDDERFLFLIRGDRPLLDTGREKIILMSKPNSDILQRYKRESTFLFKPRLPYSFLIYFRDRQKAHIEFMFYIPGKGKAAVVKRKISSGNLEADLLAGRYIARHLYLVEDQFPTNSWQSVKIDITKANDQN